MPKALERDYALVYSLLLFTGTIYSERILPAAANRVAFDKYTLIWQRLFNLRTFFKDTYSWASTDPNQPFQWERLLDNIELILESLGFDTRFILPDGFQIGDIEITESYSDTFQLHGLQAPFIFSETFEESLFYNLGLGIIPVNQENPNAPPNSLLLFPIVQGKVDEVIEVTDDINLHFITQIDLSQLTGLFASPQELQYVSDEDNLASAIEIKLEGAPLRPWIIFGSRDSHRLELNGFDLSSSLSGSIADPEIKLTFKTTSPDPGNRGVKAIIDLGESDAFIQGTAKSNSNNIEAGFDLEIEWSSKHGFRFGGNAEMDFQTHLNQKFGALEVTNFYFSILAKSNSVQNVIRLRAGMGLKGTLGPVQFFIENTGFALDATPYNANEIDKDNPPALGMMDFDLSYAPPKEIGFIVDTAPVKGVGYLIFEPENGRYVGLAELSIVDKFTVKAIAIINTELPDGQEGYSFLLMITAEFSPIQLGFGFTLEGVGGLIGIHRSMNLDAIREKVKGDSFDQVLFPEDPINNVHSIIASLDPIFPIQEGQYSFGIMGKIGWGTPKLIDIKAGLIFQVPQFKMAIIGTAKTEIVRTSVPEDGEEPEKIVLLRLQISFAAWFEPEKSLFGFDATLFNSEILGQKLTGDAALRLRGGDNPYFMLSVGGFHPEFEPPKGLGLGKLNRIEIAFKPESVDIDVSAQFYAAVTSNTVQVGAELGAEYDGPGFRIEGEIRFDALFQFRPIYFKVDVRGRVAIHVWGSSWGLGIKGSIEGPYPYRFSLYVTVDAFVGSKDFSIPTFTIGSEAREERPTIDVLEELREVIEDDRSWNPVLLDRNEVLVSVRDRRKEFSGSDSAEEAERALIVHPFGGIKIDQDRVPLDVKLERFGHKQPARHNFFSVELETEETEKLERFFAPAQFFELKKEEKLNRPSFEKMDAGVQIKDFKELQVSSRILEKEVRYETEYYDPHSPWQPGTKKPKKPMKDEDFVVWSANSSIAKSSLGKKNKKTTIRPNAITFKTEKVAEDEFAIIHQDGAAGFTNITSKNKATAHQQLEQLIIDNPELEDNLVVVPIYEIA